MKKFLSVLLLLPVLCASAQTNEQWHHHHNYGNSNDRVNAYNGVIYNSGILVTNRHYRSSNGQYYFTIQPDGNLCIYRTSNNSLLWSSGTNNRQVSKCEFQNDGNLVLTNTSGQVVWDAFGNQAQKTNTIVESSASRRVRANRSELIMQDDGNLVIYGPRAGVKWAAGSNR